MASRAQQKEQARAQRLAEEQARSEHARRQRRLRLLAIAGLIALAVVGVAIAVANSGGSSTLKSGSSASAVSSQVEQLLGGIPQSGATLGNSKAPVTMTYYGDLQCPVCMAFTLNGGFPQLVANDVRSGRVQVVYRNLETATSDPQTFQTQQVAALAAGKQNRFWDYAELFYRQQGVENSGYVTDAFLTGLARQIPGLNSSAWSSARNDSSLVAQIQSDARLAAAAGATATPTLIFKGPKGEVPATSGVPTYAQLTQAIKSVS